MAIALVAANGAAATNRDETILISLGGTTLTLPVAASVGGIVYNIRNIASTGTVTVARSGSDTIDGSTSVILAAGGKLRLVSDGGTAWYSL